MISDIAIALSALSLLVFLFNPVAGIVMIFISKPVIDTAFTLSLTLDLRLPEIVGGLVPLIAFGHILIKGQESSTPTPLRAIWTVYALDIAMFSMFIAYNQDFKSGANVFFRHINGYIGFMMVQAFFKSTVQIKILLLSLVVAGIFPMAMGLYQFQSGAVWIEAQAEGLIRNVGLYHDAFTLRAYAFQTIFAALLYSSIYARAATMKILLSAYLGIAVLVMFKTYSKAGMISLALWTACWSIIQRKYWMVGIVLLLAFPAAAYYGPDLIDNVQQLFHKEIGFLEGKVETERTFAGRWYGWQELMREWSRLPGWAQFFGSGKVATNAHNDYLQLLFHGGIVGLIIYICLLMSIGVKIVANISRKVDPLTVGSLMLYLMWLIDTIGLVPSAYPGYQWFVWGLIGLSLRLRLESEMTALDSRPSEGDLQNKQDLAPGADMSVAAGSIILQANKGGRT